jgi:hypothetical protein
MLQIKIRVLAESEMPGKGLLEYQQEEEGSGFGHST